MLQISQNFGSDAQNSNAFTTNAADKSVQTDDELIQTKTKVATSTNIEPMTTTKEEVTNYQIKPNLDAI